MNLFEFKWGGVMSRVYFGFMMEEELKKKLENEAKKHDQSLAAFIRYVLVNYIKNEVEVNAWSHHKCRHENHGRNREIEKKGGRDEYILYPNYK